MDDPQALAREMKTAFRRRLLAWFRRNRRDLPWRRNRSPYRVWISEIMLQQTRVDTVIPYFERFVKAYPSVKALARASENRVLKLWEGLGYYARARNLLKGARLLCREQDGQLPRTLEGWRRVPGVGPYAAAAIASLALGIPAAAVDGNVRRVLARLFRIRSPLGDRQTDRLINDLAAILLAPRKPGEFNEAMMELGALVCTPRRPRCPSCPLRRLCLALALNEAEQLPLRPSRRPLPHYDVVAGILWKNGRVLIGRRPPRGMLGGLWEFPGGKVLPGESPPSALKREFKEELGITVRVGRKRGSVRHAYTHFTITLTLYESRLTRGTPRPAFHDNIKWVHPSSFDRYAFPTATRRLHAAVTAP